MHNVLLMVTSFSGTLGFAMIYHIQKDKLLGAAFGGFVAIASYLVAEWLIGNDVISTFLGAVALTLYSEVMARRKKTPTTVFIVAALIPLLPGGFLYKAMHYAVEGKRILCEQEALHTFLLAAAIAVGVLAAMTLWTIAERLRSSIQR